MQKIAAYLLERRDEMNWPEARATEAARLRAEVSSWLLSKGANAIGPSGTYVSEDGSHATFTVEEADDGDQSWWMVHLVEVTTQSRRFDTAISITNRAHGVAVYATMEAGSNSTTISRVEADPRCPRVLRELLKLPGRWFHGTSELRGLRVVKGFDAGEGLAAEIKDPERTVPILVVSEDAAGTALPDLHTSLDFDLAGLANVVLVDTDAAWALTDELGKGLSCYSGAVRLYWPKLSFKEDPFRHPLWTRQRLIGNDSDRLETRERFRRQLRGLVMRAAALGIVRPREIDAIRTGASTRAFAEMKAKATSTQDYADLADSYARDNSLLREQVADLQRQFNDLQAKVVDLEVDRAALLQRVENAEVQLRYREEHPTEIPPDSGAEAGEVPEEPQPGEIRFYKKHHSTRTHDVLIRVADCGHSTWQGSNSADKARKGVAKLENGRSDWKNMQHCGSCTGGGMWRVRW